MAVEAQLFSENMGFSQDLVFSSGMGIDDNGFPIFQINSNRPQLDQAYKLLPPFSTTINTQSAAGFSSSPCSSSSTGLVLSSVDFFQYLATELEKQRAEIDFYLQIQVSIKMVVF